MKKLTKEDLPIGTKVVPHDKTIGKSFEDFKNANRSNEYFKVNRHDSKGYVVCDFEHFNYSDLTLYVEQPKIKKAELMKRLIRLEEYVKELINNQSHRDVLSVPIKKPEFVGDIGKGTIEVEEPKTERYNMTKDQNAQIDCRRVLFEFNNGGGNCSNISPAITLNDNKSFVCWSSSESEEPKYVPGTLGAFWDGDFDFALSKRCVWLGKLENQTKSGQFVMQEINMCYQNFKPLKLSR